MGRAQKRFRKRVAKRPPTTLMFDAMTDEIAHALREATVEGNPEVVVEWARKVLADYISIRLVLGGSVAVKVKGSSIVFTERQDEGEEKHPAGGAGDHPRGQE